MPTLKIDDREVAVPAGTSILHAAEELGIHIPRFCYHHGLSVAGSCRMCLVEVEDMPKLIISCATPVKDDMVVHTTTPRVRKAQRAIMEFLLINHPRDCPVCDKAGECDLQDYSYIYGNAESRFREQKIVQPKKDLGKHILIYADRCIMCSRCVRFCQEVTGTEELCVIRRTGYSEIAVNPSRRLDNLLSGNVADICPVGALTSKDFLFKCRVWALVTKDTICPLCARGCNIHLDCTTPAAAGEGYHPDLFARHSPQDFDIRTLRIVRVRGRRNDYVNGFWMCDIGRYGYKFVHSSDRLKQPMARFGAKLRPVSWSEAMAGVREGLSRSSQGTASTVVAVLSPHATNEENEALATMVLSNFSKAVLTALPAPRVGEDIRYKSGFTIFAERAANAAGVKRLLDRFPEKDADLKDVLQMARAGELFAVYLLNGDPEHGRPAGELAALRKAQFVVAHDIFPSELALLADVVFPGATYAEKCGSFANIMGYIQNFEAALVPPGTARPDLEVLEEVQKTLTVPALR